MAYQIFISYRRDGGDALAYLLYEHLTMAGYKVFYDVESLSAGKFNHKLLEVINSCSDVLLVLPPRALDRCVSKDDWLRIEIEHALKTGKNIIPVFMRGFEWSKDMPDEIKEIKNYNGVMVTFDFFEEVINKLEKYLSKSSQAAANNPSASGLKHLLLWGDFDNAYLEKIVYKLGLDEEYYVEILDDPIEILSKNLAEIEAVMLLVTDCTKFSSNIFVMEKINEVLVDYVRKGGKLICAHDVIYRRTKNEQLQEMYGCKITHFKPIETVKYVKTDECRDSGCFSSLPDEFVLHDAEICWGSLAEDVDVYFATEDGVPLVFSREYGRGRCLYLNSGDFKERPPRSIIRPEKEFIGLLHEAIIME